MMTEREKLVEHALNEWADLGSTSIQWLRNIRDDISTVDEALEGTENQYRRILELSRAAAKSLRSPPIPDGRIAREALEKIVGGFINSDCLMSDPPDWHSAFSQLQAIARTALSAPTPPSAPVVQATQNTAEGDLPVTASCAGADTPVAEMIYFKRRGSSIEDRVPALLNGTIHAVDPALITRREPLYATPPAPADRSALEEEAWLRGFQHGKQEGRAKIIKKCHDIALAIDSGRGNEKEIAKAIHAITIPPQEEGSK